MPTERTRVVALAGLSLAVSLAGDASLYAILPAHPEAAGVGLAAVGLLLSANRLVRLLLNPLAGLIYDRLGRKRPFVVALVLATLSTVLYAVLRGSGPLLGARLVWGTAWALVIVGAYSMLMDVADQANRGLMSGLVQVAYFIGVSLGMVGALLSDLVGFRAAMKVCAGITAVGVVSALLLPETRREAPAPAPTAPSRDLFAAYLLYGLGYFAVNGVFTSTLGRFLVNRWGARVTLGGLSVGAATLTGGMLVVRSVLGLIGGPLGGRLSDRFGRWPVVAATTLAAGLGFLSLVPGQVWLALAGGSCLLLAVPAMNAIVGAVVGDVSSARRRGLSFGGLATAGDAGSAAGPIIAYALVSVGFSLGTVYLACGGALLLAGVLVALWAARRKA